MRGLLNLELKSTLVLSYNDLCQFLSTSAVVVAQANPSTGHAWHLSILCVTVGDAELSSMAPGLAVGKPGDTVSISADSALGRSSIITGTTAGVTQFSEVSQITDCYWSGLF